VLQVIQDSEQVREAEETRRQEAMKDMTEKLSGITERIDSQQNIMKAQQEENERLRMQLSSIGNVVQLSERMKEQYDGELNKLCKKLVDQVSSPGEGWGVVHGAFRQWRVIFPLQHNKCLQT
jgi:regulator of sigma D